MGFSKRLSGQILIEVKVSFEKRFERSLKPFPTIEETFQHSLDDLEKPLFPQISKIGYIMPFV